MKQKRIGKNATSLLVGFVMVFSIVWAIAITTTVYAIDDKPGNPKWKGDVSTWDCIWFGKYHQSSSSTKEPIKWRVLNVNGDDAFIISDMNLDCQPYNKEYADVTWETCSLRTWLNNDFYLTAFTERERNAIFQTHVRTQDNCIIDIDAGETKVIPGGNDTNDYVYLLSSEEVVNANYGFKEAYLGDYDEEIVAEDPTRCAKNTEYAKQQGAVPPKNSLEGPTGTDYWWLRSPGVESSYAAYIKGEDGYRFSGGQYVNYGRFAVRPVLHIDLSSSVWSYAGTVSSDGRTTVLESYRQLSSNIVWKFDQENGIVTIRGLGDMPQIDYDKFPWYENRNLIKKVVIEDGITSISLNAFSDCKNLTKVTLPGTLKSVSNAFIGSGITSIAIPEGVLSIDSWAFYRCNSLTEIRLPGTLRTIGSMALQVDDPTLVTVRYNGTEADWDEISISGSNNIVQQGKFIYNHNHTYIWVIDQAATTTSTGSKHEECVICGDKKAAVTIERKPEAAKNGDKVIDDKTKATYVIGDVSKSEVTYLGSTNQNAAIITVPATVVINNVTYTVTKIADNAFKGNKKVTKVIIGKNVTTIGNKAFYKCTALTKITIPAKVTKIGKSAFEGCKKLKAVTIKATKLKNKNVGAKAFKGISATAKIKVPKKQLTAYRKMLKKKGITGKKQKIA